MKIAVAIPCYRVKKHIEVLLKNIGDEVEFIYVVDDCCPEQTGLFVQSISKDARVRVIFHETNQGVGGAVISAYQQALKDGADIVVKLDGDGQMDPSLIPKFIKPILDGKADYCKGNRFYSVDTLLAMPRVRRFGNTMLSFISKCSSGYWNIMDPTNGYTAIHRTALSLLPLDKIQRRYFFESDILFRLNLARAVVKDIPMKAIYADEVSNLSIRKTILEFPLLYLRNFFKRFFYNYVIRDFTAATIETLLGGVLVLFGLIFGSYSWISSYFSMQMASSGTVMLATLPIILGFQLLLHALSFDISNVPKDPVQNETYPDCL